MDKQTLMIVVYFVFSVLVFLDFRFRYVPYNVKILECMKIDIIDVPILDDIASRNQPFFSSSNLILFIFFLPFGFILDLMLSLAISFQMLAACKKKKSSSS